VKRIHDQRLKTLIHLVDKEWLEESWKRLRKGAAYGIDEVSGKQYAETLEKGNIKLIQYGESIYQRQMGRREL